MYEVKNEDIESIKKVLHILSTNETMDIFIEIMSYIGNHTFQNLSYNMEDNRCILNAAIFHAALHHPNANKEEMYDIVTKVLSDNESIDMCNEFIKLLI